MSRNMQKSAHLKDVSAAGQGSEARGLGFEAEIKALSCARMSVLGKSSRKDGFCYFAFPIWFTSPDL